MATLIKPAEVVNGGIYRGAPTNARFDQTIISPHIDSTEERFVIDLLGEDLYDAMVAAQNAAVSNYNPDVGPLVNKFLTNAFYETLWTKYLLRYISYAVYHEALPFITVQVSSKGAFTNGSEFADNAGISGSKYLQDAMMKRIDDLRPKIETYLCDNKADYPLFNDDDCPCSDCEDGCTTSCRCGYWQTYGTPCRTCKTGINSSTKIIFY